MLFQDRKVIGFTGRRDGMTVEQSARVYALLRLYSQSGVVVVLHGDAIGADAEFDMLAAMLGIKRMCRPCTYESQRAFTEAQVIAEPTNPMARNRAIVADADAMIGAPPTDFEVERSGTWATLRYMRKASKPYYVIKSDGGFLDW